MAYKTELDPTNKQRTLLLKHAGVARFAYNWGLGQKKLALDNKVKVPSAIDLHKKLVVLKKSEFPWMYEVSKCAPQEALRNLDRAFSRFFKKKSRFPKFKSRSKGVGSFYLNGKIHVHPDRIQLPRVGVVKLKEQDYIPTDKRVISVTVSEKACRWFVSVLVEESASQTMYPKDSNPVVGIDLGTKTLATVSDGTQYRNPKPLVTRLKKLRRLSRSVSSKIKGSQNRRKAIKKLARLHFKIRCIRQDMLHKITTHLTRTKSTVVLENLNVSGMVRNHRLARSIQDLGLYEFKRQMQYKGAWYGCRVIEADRFFPSSKRCSVCHEINQDLKLSDREWICSGCGTEHDRDLNAAQNLEQVAVSSTETLNACGEKSSGSGYQVLNETGLVEAGMRQQSWTV